MHNSNYDLFDFKELFYQCDLTFFQDSLAKEVFPPEVTYLLVTKLSNLTVTFVHMFQRHKAYICLFLRSVTF